MQVNTQAICTHSGLSNTLVLASVFCYGKQMTEPNDKAIHLPKGFLLGAGLAAHQVEGNNTNSDWWFWEQRGRLPKSGQATDHYHRYAEDFALAKSIGLTSLRISIEWARIEPTPGVWDMSAVAHYRKVLETMKEQGLVSMVTLHHYTLPQWVAAQGGFQNPKTISWFQSYVAFVSHELGNNIDLWVTINEPEVFTLTGYLQGIRPPFKHNPFAALRVYRNLIKAHQTAYEAIKQVHPHAQVGLAKNNVYHEPFHSNALDKAVVSFNNRLGSNWFLDAIQNHLDYIGLNYYFYHTWHVSWRGVRRANLKRPHSDMGWRTYPKGIYYAVTELQERYRKPIYITENGIANARSEMQQDFIREHLYWLSKTMDEGVDIRGYYYWSLTDTYEWNDGFNPKFGLIEVGFPALTRTIRPSADIFKSFHTS
jgi:beta-glucosidase